MRPTFMGFETCKRGLTTNQKVLDIVGQNLTNWDTPGYSRQRVDIVSVAAPTGATRYGSLRSELAGQGVEMAGVAQMRDSFLDKRFRDEYGDASYYIQSSQILTDIESAIKEYDTDSALLGTLRQIYTAAQTMTQSPSDPTAAGVVATAFKSMTQVLRELSSKLDNVAQQQKYDLETSVKDFNHYAERLTELNRAIRDDMAGNGGNEHYGPNELLDERNLVLDELSKYGDISVEAKKDGMVNVSMGGHAVVNGLTYDRVNYSEDKSGSVALRWNNNGKDCAFTTGSLKAFTDFINGRGPNVQSASESAERGVPYYRDKLNTFASTMANVFNSLIPLSHQDADGNWTDDPGQFKTLLGARVPKLDAAGNVLPGEFTTTVDIPVTADNISLSDEWLKDSSYVIYRTGENQVGPPTSIYDVLAGSNSKVTFRGRGETFVGSFEDYINDYTNTMGGDIHFHKGRQEATSSISNDMLDRRDSVSAVSRDEETVTMMTYQKAYQAVSRVMTTLDECLDVLINKTGLVGR